MLCHEPNKTSCLQQFTFLWPAGFAGGEEPRQELNERFHVFSLPAKRDLHAHVNYRPQFVLLCVHTVIGLIVVKV